VHSVADVGAVLFGIVVGWTAYRTLVRTTSSAQISDLATVIGAVGGAAVTGLFNNEHLFGLYSIGLAGGFFAYILVFRITNGAEETGKVLGSGEPPVRIGARDQ
jgi:zinc transporter ZupT